MVASDMRSIDHKDASPLHEHAEGVLFDNRIAIINGIHPNELPHGNYDAVIRTKWGYHQIPGHPGNSVATDSRPAEVWIGKIP